MRLISRIEEAPPSTDATKSSTREATVADRADNGERVWIVPVGVCVVVGCVKARACCTGWPMSVPEPPPVYVVAGRIRERERTPPCCTGPAPEKRPTCRATTAGVTRLIADGMNVQVLSMAPSSHDRGLLFRYPLRSTGCRDTLRARTMCHGAMVARYRVLVRTVAA